RSCASPTSGAVKRESFSTSSTSDSRLLRKALRVLRLAHLRHVVVVRSVDRAGRRLAAGSGAAIGGFGGLCQNGNGPCVLSWTAAIQPEIAAGASVHVDETADRVEPDADETERL